MHPLFLNMSGGLRMQQQARQWWRQATQMVHDAAHQPNAFEQWIEQLASRDPAIAVPAMWALQQAGAPVIPSLLHGLKHPHTRVRRSCVDCIDHGGYGADTRCVEALLPLLQDPVPHIRRAVWHTLFCERCPDATKCEMTAPIVLDRVALLVEIGANDPNAKLRGQLIGELGHQVYDARARNALKKILETERDPDVLTIAQRALDEEAGH